MLEGLQLGALVLEAPRLEALWLLEALRLILVEEGDQGVQPVYERD